MLSISEADISTSLDVNGSYSETEKDRLSCHDKKAPISLSYILQYILSK